ncbi:hypothetical protein [Winogradskyella immobilis]|uniref:O-antigen ligase-like membrane protein n=1 Tax=Winogradskyella immobilis TaxID=2816852 RepID=A0ABS8EJW4_9FLAO|nr:hypothetical protein [Winogradskyella immobilis]MCC1483488.1 hypothetical protein [Winogradskyella immobilis]MCG0015582.1 hypothetical protein [Winogradskyella immobilis]
MIRNEGVKVEGNIILIYFICQIALDFLQKINVNFNLELLPFHRYIKAVFLTYISIKILIDIKFFLKKKLLLYVFILLGLFLFSINYTEARIEYFIQYSYLYGVALFYLKYDIDHIRLKKIIKTLIIINFLFIIIGMIFNQSLFLTYGHLRFGYDGFIITQMQATVFYLSIIAYFAYLRNLFFFIIAFICGILCGTKAIFLGVLVLVILFYVFDIRNKKFRYITLIVSGISIFGLISLFQTSLFKLIVERDGLFTMVFSYRDKLLLKTFESIKEAYSVLDFLIGGYDLSIYKTELDLIDIVLFFGIIGLCIYILIFKFLYKYYCISNESKAYFITIIIVSFLGGNIIAYPFNSFLFLTTLKLIYDRRNNYS